MKEARKQLQEKQDQFTKTFVQFLRYLPDATGCEKVMYLVVSVCLLFCLSVCSHVSANQAAGLRLKGHFIGSIICCSAVKSTGSKFVVLAHHVYWVCFRVRPLLFSSSQVSTNSTPLSLWKKQM